MFRKKFRAEPAIALTVLYAALSLGARANLPRQSGEYWPQRPDQRAGLMVGPDEPGVAHAAPEKPQQNSSTSKANTAQWVHSVQLTGVTAFADGLFEPYLRYLMQRPLAMPAVDTVVQAIAAHYQVAGHLPPRIFACVDEGGVGNLIIAVFEAPPAEVLA